MSIHEKEIPETPEHPSFPLPIVVDTNVLIDGLSGGSPAAETIIELLWEGNCRLVYTKRIRGEFHKIAPEIISKEIITEEDHYFMRSLFQEGVDVTREKNRTPTLRLPTGDQEDAKFVIAARKRDRVCIISRDHHLRKLSSYEGFEDITVLTPEEFLEKFGFTS